jgi:hypothetical protein
MNLVRLLTAFSVIIGGFVFCHSSAFAQLFAILNGGNEIDPTTGVANAGDPDGSGLAGVLIRNTDPTLCYAILVTGIDTPTEAHIHEGAAGVNGPVVVPLTPPENGNPGDSEECISPDMTVLTRILQNPAGFYVNVHDAAFPNGAIRGQLLGSSPASPAKSKTRR